MSIKSTESTTLDVGPDFSESDSSHIIERFFQAAKDLDCKELDYILSVNSKLVNTKDDDNRTALHIVFQKGIENLYTYEGESVLKVLEEEPTTTTKGSGVDLEKLREQVGNNGESVDMKECVKVLMKYETDIHSREGTADEEEGFKGCTSPLQLAIQNNFCESVKLMVLHTKAQKALDCIRTATQIAENMPDVMEEILDQGISLETDACHRAVVKLDWRRVLQFGPQDIPDDVENEWPWTKSEDAKKCPTTKSEDAKKLAKMKCPSESEFVYELSLLKNVKNRARLLKHPLIAAFLYMKQYLILTQHTKLSVFVGLVIGIFPVLYLGVFYYLYEYVCTFDVETDSPSYNYNTSTTENAAKSRRMLHCEKNIFMVICTVLIYLYTVGYFVCEFLVYKRSNKSYKVKWRSCLNMIAFFVMVIAVIPGISPSDGLQDMASQYAIASVGVILAWIMVLVQLGSMFFPENLEILVKILVEVVKVTLMFFPMLIGFFMGFKLLFGDEITIFEYIMLSTNSPTVDYEDLIKESSRPKSLVEIVAYFFSGSFIVLITIVFMNFLLAMSIRDVQELTERAELSDTENYIAILFTLDLLIFPFILIPKDKKDDERVWCGRFYLSGPHKYFKLRISKNFRNWDGQFKRLWKLGPPDDNNLPLPESTKAEIVDVLRKRLRQKVGLN